MVFCPPPFALSFEWIVIWLNVHHTWNLKRKMMDEKLSLNQHNFILSNEIHKWAQPQVSSAKFKDVGLSRNIYVLLPFGKYLHRVLFMEKDNIWQTILDVPRIRISLTQISFRHQSHATRPYGVQQILYFSILIFKCFIFWMDKIFLITGIKIHKYRITFYYTSS